ncbi:S10 family serine carboxypeptidase-like protein [Nannocystaceae bacterium ST9]
MKSRLAALVLLASACRQDAGSDSPAGGSTDDELGESSESVAELPDLPDDDASTGETETGDPACLDPQPCRACECVAGEWACECPTIEPEAGFVTIEARDYSLSLPGDPPTPLSADGHRQFLAFRPADEDPEHAPIFVLFNGGPAVSTGMLLGLNLGPWTFAPAATAGEDLAANPHSWTSLGNLLWIDAHHVGFSYSLLDDPSDPLARQAALSFANFNAYLDAADFVRVLLEFLATHAELRDNPVVVVGESYGGTRAQLMLDMLLHPQAYASGERRMIDLDLTARIAAHHEQVLGEPAPTPELAAEQFGRQILIQPALTGVIQQQSAGVLFEQPGSPLDQLALEFGVDYVTCAEQQPPCTPYDNGLDFIGSLGRSPYDTRAPASWLEDLFALVDQRCNDAAVIGQLLGVPLDAIVGASPAERAQAWRTVDPTDYPSDAELGDLDRQLGALAPWDRYFLVFEYGTLAQFRGYQARQLDVEPADPHYGEHLLRNLLWVDTLITSADYDMVVHTPAIPAALAHYDAIVAAVAVEPGQWTIDYRPDAFAQWPDPGARTLRVPSYAASHAVSMDAPAQLLADVDAWLNEP